MTLKRIAFAAASFFALATPALGQELARKGVLGVALEAGDGGARIVSVTPGLTAAQAGLQAGDTITAINGTTTPNQGAVVNFTQTLRSGAPVSFTYRRSGETKQARANALPRPIETYQGASAKYGAVAFKGGQLRDILVTPSNAKADGPVVYFIQGVTCGTIEGATPQNPYRAMAQGLADRGISFYRVEKPGIGDSAGTPNCVDTDFATELDAFRAGLNTLINTHKIEPSRIVFMGHSMGGVQAPLLAAETPDRKYRGMAVMGTAVRPWRDYLIEVFRVQGFLSHGIDPAENEQTGMAVRPLLDRMFADDTPLATIAADSKYADLLRDALGWTGGETWMSRTIAYWRGVDRAQMARAWRSVNAPVLAVYGETDFAAIDERDHKLLVEMVNHYRPGTARYAFLPKTGHGFGLEGTRAEAQVVNRQTGMGMNPNAPYNPEMTKVLADWIDTLAKP